jgi:hypothetical protein
MIPRANSASQPRGSFPSSRYYRAKIDHGDRAVGLAWHVVVGTAGEYDHLMVVLTRGRAQALAEPRKALAVAVHQLIVEDDRGLQVSGDRQTEQCRELLTRSDRQVLQLTRRSMRLDLFRLQVRSHRNRTVPSAAQQEEAVSLAHAEVLERERTERSAFWLLREIQNVEAERATHLGRALAGPIGAGDPT